MGRIIQVLLVICLIIRFTPAVRAEGYSFGLIGNSLGMLEEEREAGIVLKEVRISWRDLFPNEGKPNQAYIASKKEELRELRDAGFAAIPSFGIHDTPEWVHRSYKDTYFIDQYGDKYDPGDIDCSTANLVFNPEMRKLVEAYVSFFFKTFGDDFYAVRLGWGHWGELGYPAATYNGNRNTYWAFDRNAQASCPVPGWHPGDPSPNNEASRFINWYLDSLVDFQNWQIRTVRKYYKGPLMMLYPSWGIRQGQLNQATKANLRGRTSVEINGELQRGYDFARQIGAISDPGVVVTTTWLDASDSGDTGTNMAQWSPVKYLSYLADTHPLKLKKFGENTGQGDIKKMELCFKQIRLNRLIGMVWYREEEMFSGAYGTLEDYSKVIKSGEK